ncbi:peroxidase family protein, partial [Rhizobium cauense]|uniref:peroxidase family protein n=1 Tax=Rhizobium cauense TaxID=1166683 RepID=UPI001C6EC59F
MVQLNKHDLEFILKQIKVAEAHASGTSLTELVSSQLVPYGLRTVDGSFNNLAPGQEHYGSSDQVMQRLLDAQFNPAEGAPAGLHGPSFPGTPGSSYAQTSGSVYDSQPRVISNLVVDQSIANPATMISALINLGHSDPYSVLAVPANAAAYAAALSAFEDYKAAEKSLAAAKGALAALFFGPPPSPDAIAAAEEAVELAEGIVTSTSSAKLAAYEVMEQALGVTMEGDSVLIPNVSADLGDTAPFNGFFTLFGQFFDHGLDLVSKGGSGTVYIPLHPDDPLYVPGSPTNFMVLTRAQNQPGADGIIGTADDVREHTNETTPWIDLNQVYTSNPSHQVFLREYVLVDAKPVATGHMLEGINGGPPTWADVKAQALNILGIELTDRDVLRVPAVATDLYGEFVRGANGFPQLVTSTGSIEGDLTNPAEASSALSAGRAFLNDIAHTAAPVFADTDGDPTTLPALMPDDDLVAGNAVPVDNRGNNLAYDNELLDAHYIVGDGRGNENIGLTSVHHLFHHEHNRQIDAIKQELISGPDADVAFLNEWLLQPVDALPSSQAEIDALVWDGERLFQAGRFSTEMVYQHLVFEEFARAVSPNIDPFVFSNSVDIDPAIAAEFAHVVYRFGHSMLTEDVSRLNLLLGTDGEVTAQEQADVKLMDAFLNPIMFAQSGVDAEAAAGAILRGMSRQVGNEIDEYVTDALRNNLVGLPLDLAALNMTRARETGVPSLNAARRDFYAQTQDSMLKPYESWFDFALSLKNPASLINFIAAYGTHTTIANATTLEDKRAAATALVLGGTGAPEDRLDFLNGRGAWASLQNGVTTTGLDTVDFWIGGLAEKKMPFGGMLGSTFNFVFEAQMEKLQNGDRFYYLSRTQGLNLLNELEADSFAQLVMRNTDTEDQNVHLNGAAFQTANYVLEIDQAKQFNAGLGSVDPTGTNPILQAINPLVIRQDLDGDGTVDYLRFTGGEHVVLGGSSRNDTLIGGEGDDTLWGGAGDDRLEGGFGVDHLHGGDGDDIITDSGTDVGAADVIHGDAGEDVINGGNGLDLIFGGDDSDFIYGGSESKTISGGEGNDFIRGASGPSFVAGNEGDDWLEGGDGFDTLAGENSELFFNSTIIGHDVLNGRGNDNDYDAESGDDIMFQGPGIQRNNGMAGFDWAIHKGDTQPANSDMNISIFVNQQNNILRDRFDLVEGLSGWTGDDVLRGRDVVIGAYDENGNATQVDPDAPLDSYSNALLAKNLHLIDGLEELTAHLQRTQVTVAGKTETIVMDTSDASDIILGGAGSDVIEGMGGNDIIDGDKWLNVRILVTPDTSRGQTWSAFSIDELSEIQARMYSGEIKPGQLQIVREILDGGGAGDVDAAVYWDSFDNYTITGNADGSLTVAHTTVGPVVVDPTTGRAREADGTDRLFNIEKLQFADRIVDTAMFFNSPATGAPVILDQTPLEGQALTLNLASVADTNGLGTFSYQWQSSANGTTWTSIAGATSASFTPQDLPLTFFGAQAGLQLRVIVSFTDGFGNAEQVVSAATSPVGVNWSSLVGLTPFNGTEGDDVANGALLGETLNGNGGNDALNGGGGADTIAGGAGNDTINGGAGGDTAVFNGPITNYRFAATLVGQTFTVTVTDTTGADGIDTLTSVETLRFAGVNYAIVAGNNAANTNLNGAVGATGSQAIFGLDSVDTINGGAGNDFIDAGAGSDTITQTGSTGGRDIVDGGAGVDTYRLNGDTGAETFRIYTRTEALAQITGLVLSAETEIVITRNGTTANTVIAELDNIEEIFVSTLNVSAPGGIGGGAVGGDSVVVIGDFSTTSLNLNTITIDGDVGNDVIDISALTSAHRIVFRSNGGQDTIIGTLRSQDVIELPQGATAASYSTATDEAGMTTLSNPTTGHSISFHAAGTPQLIEAQPHDDDDGDDDDQNQGGDDDDDGDDGSSGGGDDDDNSSGGDDDDDGTTPLPVAARTLIGTVAADVLVGAGGADTILGGGAGDIVVGDAGSDILKGEDGDDVVTAGDGDD